MNKKTVVAVSIIAVLALITFILVLVDGEDIQNPSAVLLSGNDVLDTSKKEQTAEAATITTTSYVYKVGDTDSEKGEISKENIHEDNLNLGSKSIYTNPATEKDILLLENHRRILQGMKQIVGVFKTPDSSSIDVEITPQDLKEWSITLYQDALLSQALALDLGDPVRLELLQRVQSVNDKPDLEILNSQIPGSGDYYANTLRELLASIYEADLYSVSKERMLVLARKIYDLMARRKRNSDNYYITEIRTFLLDDAYGLDEKIVYMEPFIVSEDWTLAEYGAEYFSDLHEYKTLGPEEKRKIQSLLKRSRYKEKK